MLVVKSLCGQSNQACPISYYREIRMSGMDDYEEIITLSERQG
ncbi:MAG: hypothetical protein RPU52_01160 [Candidatus Sedimenticola sp. (ex Thyasira tokunagai)]